MPGDNGGAQAHRLEAIVRAAIWTFPPEVRLQVARKMIAFFTDVERSALRDLGGVDPVVVERERR